MSGLVGRDGELAQLRELVGELAAGRGRSVWVEGEPGIGKSALVTAGLAQAPALGCREFRSQADEATARMPLQLVLDLLLRGLAADDPARAQVTRLLAAPAGAVVAPDQAATASAAELLVDLVQRWCAEAPVLLIADDLQWADELSLAIWGRLQRLTQQLPLLLASTCRQIPHRPQLAPLRDRSDVVLELAPLAPAAVTELTNRLISAAPGPALAKLTAQAGGNPLYLEELLASLTREQRIRVAAGVADLTGPDTAIPASLAGAISARLGFLATSTVEVLRLAALLGPRLTVAQLTGVTGRPATALLPVIDEAIAAGVLVDSGDALAFRHGLIRQALTETLPPATRHALHRQAARSLAATGAAAEQVAVQLLAIPAGEVDRELAGWVLTAAPLLVHRAPEVAVDLLRHIHPAAGADLAERDRLDAHLATALFLLGRYEEVGEVARPVLARTTDPELAGSLTWALGYALTRRQAYDEALAVVDQALTGWPLPPVWDARTRALRALVLVSAFRFDEAAAAAAPAQAAGTAAGDPVAVGYALQVIATVESLARRDYPAVLATTSRALTAIGDEPATIDLRILMLHNRREVLSQLGQPAAADQALGASLALAEQAGSPTRQALARVATAEGAFERGRWDDALAELATALELPLDANHQLRLQGIAALIALFRDDQPTLVGCLRDLDERDWTGYERYLGQHLLIARALAAERAGRPAQALTRLREVFQLAGDHPQPDPQVSHLWLPGVVRLALETGDRATAEAVIAAGQVRVEQEPFPVVAATAGHSQGLGKADPTLLQQAAEAYQRLCLPFFQAQALEDAAGLHAQAGDPSAARAAFRCATDCYRQLGAAWNQRRAQARLRHFGIRPGSARHRPRPATGWEALTPTERTVASLVTNGHSNPDIAAQLYLSRRTVETHVSHILTKLDARSRVDIARHTAAHTDQDGASAG